jgi:hypothetical protein
LAVVTGAAASALPQRPPIEASDRIDLPPERREFQAPGRHYLLVVATADAWKTAYPTAELLDIRSGSRHVLWSRVLAQQFGPRAALVSDRGQVLLVDEWINVTSRWALQLLDVNNRVVATHPHDAVLAALGVPSEVVSREARSGTWLSSAPALSADGQSARIAAGGRSLWVSLVDGRLNSSP